MSPRYIKSILATQNQIATRIVSTNPATGEVLGEFECASAEAVRASIERARAAQPQWSRRPMSERLGVVEKFQTALQTQKTEIAASITREAGKTHRRFCGRSLCPTPA